MTLITEYICGTCSLPLIPWENDTLKHVSRKGVKSCGSPNPVLNPTDQRPTAPVLSMSRRRA